MLKNICALILILSVISSAAQAEKSSKKQITFFEKSLHPFNTFDAKPPVRVQEPTFDGKYAMRWTQGYIGFSPQDSWSGFNALLINTYSPNSQELTFTLEIKDDESRDYWTRVNYPVIVKPGLSQLRIPLELYVGEKSRPGRSLHLDKIRSVILSRSIQDEGKSVLLGDWWLVNDRIDPPRGVVAFDFGTETSPLFPGMIRFTKTTRYTKEKGYGLTQGMVWDPYPQASYVLQPDSLYSDSLLIGNAEITVDLPDGEYRLFMNLDYAGGYWGEYPYYRVRRVFANDKPILIETQSRQQAMDRFYHFASSDDYWSDDVFEKYTSYLFKEKLLKATVTGGKLKLRFEGENCSLHPCFGLALSTLVIIPENQLKEGYHYLKKVRERRKSEFDSSFRKASQINKGSLSVEQKAAISKQGEMVLFPMEPLKELQQNDLPPSFTENSAIKGFAAQGVSEPLTFGVYPLRDFNNVKVAVSNLIHEKTGQIIPSQNVDLGWVSYRLKRSNPEGSLYEISERYVRPGGRAELKAHLMSRVWSVLHVPNEAKPGVYRGNFSITPSKGVSQTIPIEFRVFSYPLAPVDFPVGPFNSHIIENGWYPEELRKRKWKSFIASLDKMRKVGLTSFSFSPEIKITPGRGALSLNLEHINQVMEEAKKRGFMGLVGYGDIFKEFHSCKDDPRTLIQGASLTSFYRTVTEILNETSIKNDWLPLTLVVCDEPLESESYQVSTRAEILSRVSSPRIQWSMTFSLTDKGEHSHSFYQDLYSLFPTPFLNEVKSSVMAELRELKKTWAYYNDADRSTFGFYMFKLRNQTLLRNRIAWNWNQNAGNPYYALDSREDDENWCNNDQSGQLICSVFLDRHIMSGLTDYRYALTLRKALTESPELSKSPLFQEGSLLLEEVMSVDPLTHHGDRKVERYLRLQHLRQKIAEFLEKIFATQLKSPA